jgi:hypothetical protein
MPLHFGKIFGLHALLTVIAFVLWLLWGSIFAGETFDKRAASPHAELGSRIMALGAGGQVGYQPVKVAKAALPHDPERLQSRQPLLRDRTRRDSIASR